MGKSCAELMWSAEKEVKHREAILEQDETQRFQCVAEEHRLHKAEMDTCGDLKSLTGLVAKDQPPSINSLAASDKTVEKVEELLRRNRQFANEFYPQLQQGQAGCTAATEASHNAHATCQADEDTIEAFYCTMRYGRDEACEGYKACFEEKSKAFDKTIADVRELEEHTKQQFKKLTCFGRGISEEGVGNTHCDPDALNVAHLTVTFPVKPNPKPCVPLMHTRRDLSALVTCKEGSVVPHKEISAPPAASNSTADANSSLLLEKA